MVKSGDNGTGNRPARRRGGRGIAGDADPIGRRLRDFFRAVEREDLPERLKALLHRLAEQDNLGERGQ